MGSDNKDSISKSGKDSGSQKGKQNIQRRGKTFQSLIAVRVLTLHCVCIQVHEFWVFWIVEVKRMTGQSEDVLS